MCKNSYEHFRSTDGENCADGPANPVDCMVSRQDEMLLRELLAQRTMNQNHKAAKAAQSSRESIADMFLQNVPRERYEQLVDLAIEALQRRLAC